MILSGTKEGCSGSNNDNSLEVPTKTRKSAAKYIQLNLQCFLRYHTRCNMFCILGTMFVHKYKHVLHPAGRSGPDGL